LQILSATKVVTSELARVIGAAVPPGFLIMNWTFV
jgi:hypothetical protein